LNIVSALVDTAEQAEFLVLDQRGADPSGSRNGYEPGRVRTAEGAFEVDVPQVRGAGSS